MKILRVLPELHYGGPETRSRLLAERIGPGFDVTTCVLGRVGALYEAFKARGLPTVHLGEDASIRNLRCTLRLAAVIRRLKPDIVHAAILEANFHAVLASLICRIPALVIEEVGVAEKMVSRSRKLRQVLTFMYRRPTRIVAISEAVRSYLIDVEHAPAERVQTIMNCYADRFGPPPGDLKREGSTSLRLLSVARLMPQKNLVFLPELAKALTAQGVDFTLRIAGEGPERARIEARIETLGVGDRVELLGYRDDIPHLMWTSDLLLHPVHLEGYGLVIAEALACRLPVLATPVGGIPEVVGPLAQDWLIPPEFGRWVSQIDAFSKMTKAERQQAVEPGVEFVTKNLSPEIYLERLRAMYREVCP